MGTVAFSTLSRSQTSMASMASTLPVATDTTLVAQPSSSTQGSNPMTTSSLPVVTSSSGYSQPSTSKQTTNPMRTGSLSVVTSTSGYVQSSTLPGTSSPMPMDTSYAASHSTGFTHSPMSTQTSNPSSASTSFIEPSSSASSGPPSSLYSTAGVPTIPPTTQTGAKKFVFSFKITNRDCTVDIRENNAESDAYKNIANEVVAAVNTAFRNDPYYLGSRVYQFDCGSVIPFVEVSKNGSATGNSAAELKPAEDMVKNGTASSLAIDISSFSSSPTTSVPNLYIKLDTELSNSQFCLHKSNFKNKLAAILVSIDGQSFVNPAQIVIFGSNCNDRSVSYNTAKISFYVTGSANQVLLPDPELTSRAYKLIKQFVEDGTTWRLSASFDDKVSKLLVDYFQNCLVDKLLLNLDKSTTSEVELS